MNYLEAFDKIRTTLEKTSDGHKDGHFAVQVRLTDEDCGGILYLERKDKHLYAEPYDYYDNDVDIASGFDDFINILSGSLDAKQAYDDGRIFISGNADEFFSIADLLRSQKAAKKKAKTVSASQKRTAAKSTSAVKKRTVSKSAISSEIQKTPGSDTISEVIENGKKVI